jgi:prephenate dehydrogenase
MIVAIVGVGQIGGSLSAAIRKRSAAAQVVEIDKGDDLADVRIADIVVLAAPSRTILELIPKVVPLMRAGTLLTDVAGVKEPVVLAYRKHRRRDISFIPGHPMAGTENRDLRDPDLFAGKTWFTLASDPRLDGMLTAIGAVPTLLRDAKQHDEIVAAISHLPHAIAAALHASAGPHLKHAGSSFRDATRVLLSDPTMVADFLALNRTHLRDAIQTFIQNLKRIPDMTAEELEALLKSARRTRGKA